MNGGSYNYLCHADFDTLVTKQEELQMMADRLAGLGYAIDAAKETQELLLILRQCENRVEAMTSKLSDVWRAVELWDSSDSEEKGVIEALNRYRA